MVSDFVFSFCCLLVRIGGPRAVRDLFCQFFAFNPVTFRHMVYNVIYLWFRFANSMSLAARIWPLIERCCNVLAFRVLTG
jgi:hypothetical protein